MVISEVSNYALVAKAAYIEYPNGHGEGDDLNEDAMLAANFIPSEIGLPVNNYSLVYHRENTSNGFSATIYKQRTDGVAGQYVLSIRGTERTNLNDVLGADFHDIGTYGLAVAQAIDLFNYYQVVTSTAGQPIIQYAASVTSDPSRPGRPYLDFSYSSSEVANGDGILKGKHG